MFKSISLFQQMESIEKIVVLLLSRCLLVTCFWPVAYKVNLSQSETFHLLYESMPDEDTNNDEMLNNDDIEGLGLAIDDRRLDRLHNHFRQSNRNRPKEDLKLLNYRYTNTGYDIYDDHQMLRNDSIMTQHNNLKLPEHEDSKRIVKRSVDENTDSQQQDYNYDNLKLEYYNELEKQKESNSSFKYIDKGKEEETIKESVEKIVVFKKPINCTEEEQKNIGVEAVGCILTDVKHTRTKAEKIRLMKICIRLFVVWLIIYGIIGAICWCHSGWCCCCCVCCSFCQPNDTLKTIKEYIAANPPGSLATETTTSNYDPSIYEKELYDELIAFLRSL